MSGALVLMYHSVGDTDAGRPSRYDCSSRAFALQLKLLRWLGCRFVSLSDIVDHLSGARGLPARSIAITLDDGFRNTWDRAFPTLRAVGAPATVFLATDYVGRTNLWMTRQGFAEQAMLSWAQIRSMSASGIAFGGHSRSHPFLTTLSGHDARAEIEGCKAVLENQLGIPIHHFAYPYGDFGPRERLIVQQAGFTSASGITPGWNDATTEPFDLRRVEIRGTDSLPQFAYKVLFACDQVHWLDVGGLRRRRRRRSVLGAERGLSS